MNTVALKDPSAVILNILLPVYNEERRLEAGVRGTHEFLRSSMGDGYKITIVDNASVDETRSIAAYLVEEIPAVEYLHVAEKGVGAAIRAGIAANEYPIVGYMDVDLSTDVRHLADVMVAFGDNPDVDMVNGSRWNKASDTAGRKWYRNVTSHGLSFVLRTVLGMRATDAICGFKFFRKPAADRLVQMADAGENGWFFVIEMLLRAERSGMKVYELPVTWRDDHDSTVDVAGVTWNYLRHIWRLRRVFKTETRGEAR